MVVVLAGVGMNSFHGKLSLGKSSGLVKDNGLDIAEQIKVICSFYKDSFSGSSSDSSEECQRNADNQGTRAGNHKKHKRPVEPGGKSSGEISGQHRRNKSQNDGSQYHNRGIYPCETSDESLFPGFLFSRIFHKVYDLGSGAFPERLGCPYFQQAAEVDAAGHHLV